MLLPGSSLTVNSSAMDHAAYCMTTVTVPDGGSTGPFPGIGPLLMSNRRTRRELRMRRFGDTIALFTNTTEFVRRLEAAATRADHRFDRFGIRYVPQSHWATGVHSGSSIGESLQRQAGDRRRGGRVRCAAKRLRARATLTQPTTCSRSNRRWRRGACRRTRGEARSGLVFDLEYQPSAVVLYGDEAGSVDRNRLLALRQSRDSGSKRITLAELLWVVAQKVPVVLAL